MGERLDYLAVCVQIAQEKIDKCKQIDKEKYNTVRSYDIDDMEEAKMIVEEYRLVFEDDFKFKFMLPQISLRFVWNDLWVGAYITKSNRFIRGERSFFTIYICIIPMVVLKIHWGNEEKVTK